MNGGQGRSVVSLLDGLEDDGNREKARTALFVKAAGLLVVGLSKEELLDLHSDWDQNDAFFEFFAAEVEKVAPECFA